MVVNTSWCVYYNKVSQMNVEQNWWITILKIQTKVSNEIELLMKVQWKSNACGQSVLKNFQTCSNWFFT